MENSIYKGIVNGLGDDYAEYYTAEEYAEIMEKTSGTFYGIGAYVTQNTDTGAITIVKPMKNSPAEKAGLKAGDIIYAINDERVSGKDLSAVLAQIKGEEGSKVKLTIVRSGENDYLTFSVKRAKIQEDTVSSHHRQQCADFLRRQGAGSLQGGGQRPHRGQRCGTQRGAGAGHRRWDSRPGGPHCRQVHPLCRRGGPD